jgi:putative phage-type endonuclease
VSDLPYEVIGDSANRAAWLHARADGIGASEMPAVMGESKYDSALSVYARKIGAVVEDGDSCSEAAYWGLRLEKIVADEFTFRTKIEHEWHGKLLRSKQYPWALATLDAVALGEPLECKTANQFLLGDWAEGAPIAYQIQAHQQMMVTGAQHCRVACLIGGQKFVWTEVDRDESLIRRIIHQGTEFWRRVQELDAPKPDGSDSSFEALDALHGTHNGVVQLPGELISYDDEREALKADLKKLKKRSDEIDALFQASIGSAEQGVLGNGVAYRLIKINRSAYSVAETTYTQLRRKELKNKVA